MGDYEERVSFETLWANLSALFINLPSDQVDAAVEKCQREICDCLGLDLSVLWQWEVATPGHFGMTHYYRRVDGPPLDKKMNAADLFPWSLREVQAGRSYSFSPVEEAPEEAARDVESWRQLGVKTIATFPLSAGGGAPFGVISFHDMGVARRWTEPLLKRLALIAEVFANAIIRKRVEQELRESEERVSLATAAAEAGHWMLNVQGTCFWVGPKIMDLFGLPPGDSLELERFLDLVHADDRPRLREVIIRATVSREMAVTDYRIVRPDGAIRWMHSRGRLCLKAGQRQPQLMGITSDITSQKEVELKLQQALEEIHRLRDQLANENVYLRQQVLSESGHGAIVGESEPVRKMLAMARKVAATDSAVLITGETGTGKELLAQAIHDLSSRGKNLMVKVNCAALPAPLIESELFGREKGAYTGAMTQQVGRFEIANGSTIFLDEIGDLPLELQAKLLRVLQDGQFERLGSHRTLKTDVRVIAATNRILAAMIGAGTFREDLFHRLNVFPIEVPPLRTRGSDIPLLVWKFVKDFNARMGRSISSIPKSTMEQLRQYPWAGNVRELRNVIERAMIVSDGHSLKVDLPKAVSSSGARPATLEALEQQHILEVLEYSRWRISGKDGAAEILGLLPTTLHFRMKKLGISRPKPGS